MPDTDRTPTGAERLHKFLARSGMVSRRTGEDAILAGRVAVNGQVVRRLGTCVDPRRDTVSLDGRPVRPKAILYVALHKPRGYVCSKRRQGRAPLVGELMPAEWTGLQSVGRLDKESEGLLLLTNDGDFLLHVTHPRFGTPKTYLATVTGRVQPGVLARLVRGVRDAGELLRAQKVRLVKAHPVRSLVELTLTEGRHREVRRLLASQGFSVTRLVRTHIGPVRLGHLGPGRWRFLTEAEVQSLREKGTRDATAFEMGEAR